MEQSIVATGQNEIKVEPLEIKLETFDENENEDELETSGSSGTLLQVEGEELKDPLADCGSSVPQQLENVNEEESYKFEYFEEPAPTQISVKYDDCENSFTLVYRGERSLNKGNKHKCEICKKGFAHLGWLIAHRRVHTEQHKCEICLEIFPGKGFLRKHLRSHSNFTCEICLEIFPGKGFLRKHLRSHSNFTCEICMESFPDIRLLQMHRRSHAGNECDICLKSFSTSSSLLTHRVLHDYPYKCDVCPIGFKREPSLLAHKRRLHTGEKTFKCDDCPKSYDSELRLLEHRCFHTDEQHSLCNDCGENLTSNSEIYTHKLIHAEKKPFKCDNSKKSFKTKKCRPIFTGEKLYECEYCQRRFSMKCHLGRHLCRPMGEKKMTE